MKTIITLIFAVFCANAAASDLPDMGEPALGRYELTKGQALAETAYMALWYVDYRQTMDIKNYCKRLHPNRTADANGIIWFDNGGYCEPYESNLLLGPHPSDSRIRNYFLGFGLAQFAITKALPSEYRPYWIGAGIAVQLFTVIKNRQLGLHFTFN